MDVQSATKGASRKAAACARTSLPRPVPPARTAVAERRSASSATACPVACGAKSAKAACSATWITAAPWAASSAEKGCGVAGDDRVDVAVEAAGPR